MTATVHLRPGFVQPVWQGHPWVFAQAVARTDDTELTPLELAACEPFYDDSAALLRSFVDHVRHGALLECSGADHLVTLALCFAAIESSETGCAVHLPEFCARHGIALSA